MKIIILSFYLNHTVMDSPITKLRIQKAGGVCLLGVILRWNEWNTGSNRRADTFSLIRYQAMLILRLKFTLKKFRSKSNRYLRAHSQYEELPCAHIHVCPARGHGVAVHYFTYCKDKE